MRDRTNTAWFLTIAAWLVLAANCLGQTARWVKLPTVRAQTGSGVVAEMVARLPDTSIMRGEDYVGRGHYASHGLSSYVQNKYGRGTDVDNAAYLPGGWAFIAPEPTRFTLSDVIRRTQSSFPWGQDMIRTWNRQPLYATCDECAAYTLGTIAGIEAGQPNSSRTRASFRFAGDMLAHAKTTVILARERGYPHVEALADYVERVEYIHGQIHHTYAPVVGAQVMRETAWFRQGAPLSRAVTTGPWQGCRARLLLVRMGGR